MASKEIYDLQELFEAVQINTVFADSKTFVDCIAKFNLDLIAQKYFDQRDQPLFDLTAFVKENFEEPPVFGANYEATKRKLLNITFNNFGMYSPGNL